MPHFGRIIRHNRCGFHPGTLEGTALLRRDISDVVVLVSEYDPVSAAGIERLKGLMWDLPLKWNLRTGEVDRFGPW